MLPGKQAHERGCPQAAALQRGPGNGGCQVGSERKIESAVVSAVQQEVSTLSIGNDAYLSTRSQQIASFALRRFR